MIDLAMWLEEPARQNKELELSRGESIYRYVPVYVCQLIYDTLFWWYPNIMSGLKIAYDCLAQSSKLKNGLYQKANPFWEYSVKKEYDAAERNLCFNELQHQVGKQISLSITNDIIFCQPNAPHIWQNLLITSVPWLFSDIFDLFHGKCLNKLFIQYIGYLN